MYLRMMLMVRQKRRSKSCQTQSGKVFEGIVNSQDVDVGRIASLSRLVTTSPPALCDDSLQLIDLALRTTESTELHLKSDTKWVDHH